MDNTIYYILGALAVIFVLLSTFSKKRSRKRKERKFMDGYNRKDRNKGTS
jgi:hypothetical protein